jgi:hypothetical protein
LWKRISRAGRRQRNPVIEIRSSDVKFTIIELGRQFAGIAAWRQDSEEWSLL